MPFKSDKQRRYLFSQKPDVARQFLKHAAQGAVTESPDVVLVGDGGKDPSAEEYLFIPEGSRAIVAPKRSAREEPTRENAMAALQAFMKKMGNKRIKRAQAGIVAGQYGIQGSDIRADLVPSHLDAGWFVNPGGTLQMSRPVDPVQAIPTTEWGGPAVAPVTRPTIRPRTTTPRPTSNPAPAPSPRPLPRPEEVDIGVGLGTNRVVSQSSPVSSPGGLQAAPPAGAPNLVRDALSKLPSGYGDQALSTLDRVNARGGTGFGSGGGVSGVSTAGGLQVADTPSAVSTAGGLQAVPAGGPTNIADPNSPNYWRRTAALKAAQNMGTGFGQGNLPYRMDQIRQFAPELYEQTLAGINPRLRGRVQVQGFKHGGVVGYNGGMKQKRIKRAQAGLLAGPSGNFLGQLAGLAGLGNQTSGMALDFMNSVGQVNPAVFGQTDPSVIRGMLPGGPTLDMQRFQESMRQFDAGNALQRELQQAQLANALNIANVNAGVGRESNAVQRDLGNKRINLDRLLGTQQNQMQARQMLTTRASRQLNAPMGQVTPTLAPILGRSSI